MPTLKSVPVKLMRFRKWSTLAMRRATIMKTTDVRTPVPYMTTFIHSSSPRSAVDKGWRANLSVGKNKGFVRIFMVNSMAEKIVEYHPP